MAKMKGTFGVSVSKGNAAGFSNIPGVSSYTYTMGKQFVDKFGKSYNKAKKNQGTVKPPAPAQTGSGNSSEDSVTGNNPKFRKNAPQLGQVYDGEVVDQGALPAGKGKSEDIIDAEIVDTPKAIGGSRKAIGAPPRLAIEAPKGVGAPASSPAMAESAAKQRGGQLGSFTVSSGTGQVKTRTRQLSLADIQDPNSPSKRPIQPENIPASYKPQGIAPSSRTWSEADKAALESERPGAKAQMPQAKMEKDAPVSASSPKPKKSTPPSPKGTSTKSKQFSGTNDTSNQPPVNLDNLG